MVTFDEGRGRSGGQQQGFFNLLHTRRISLMRKSVASVKSGGSTTS